MTSDLNWLLGLTGRVRWMMQATFKVTLEVPSEVTALSNMPVVEEKVNGDVKTVCYEESPLMSTYLVAFVVGLFDVINDVTNDGKS